MNNSDTKLSSWVHKPPKVYTFSFIVGDIIPKSVKCIHSATKKDTPVNGSLGSIENVTYTEKLSGIPTS